MAKQASKSLRPGSAQSTCLTFGSSARKFQCSILYEQVYENFWREKWMEKGSQLCLGNIFYLVNSDDIYLYRQRCLNERPQHPILVQSNKLWTPWFESSNTENLLTVCLQKFFYFISFKDDNFQSHNKCLACIKLDTLERMIFFSVGCLNLTWHGRWWEIRVKEVQK